MIRKIPYVEKKEPDWSFVAEVLEESRDSGIWANFGPVSRRFEAEVQRVLDLPPDRVFVATASGTAALHALVRLHEFLAGRPLRWLVSAYTFACQLQGPLMDALPLDCRPDGNLSLERVEEVPDTGFDGLIVTNLMGSASEITAWEEWTRRRGKVLLFDSAMGFGTTFAGVPLGRYGDGECFSFHHTKPLGFGEGGGVTVSVELENTLRSILNFGRYAGIDTGRLSMNGKLSDPAAAFLLDRLRGFDSLRQAHRAQWQRIQRVAESLDLEVLARPEETGFPSCAWLAARTPIADAALRDLPVIHARQYAPLCKDAREAWNLYRRSFVLPTHPGVSRVEEVALEESLGRVVLSLGLAEDRA